MMRLVRRIRGEEVVILVDYGSTHSFLDPSIAQKIRLAVDKAAELSVRVAN